MWYIMYGNFLKWNVTQIIHVNRIFHYYKPSILGYPHQWNPPYIYLHFSGPPIKEKPLTNLTFTRVAML